MTKEKNKIDITLRSEEVQEILTQVPNWTIRWGNTFILGILLMLLFLCWFIKYPDIIQTSGILTTQIPPEKEIANITGKIEAILIQDQQQVDINQPLAVIENTAKYEDVFLLKHIIDTIEYTKDSFYFPFDELPILFLGDIESQYALFENSYIQYRLNKQLKPYATNTTANKYSLSELESRLRSLESQKAINKTELAFQKKELERNISLYQSGIISTQEYENKQLAYAQAERSFKNFETSISQIKESISAAKKNTRITEIDQIREELTLYKAVIQSFNQLKKAVKDWELLYVLKASQAGRVSFLDIWNKNQIVTQGNLIFIVIPNDGSSYLGRLQAPAINSGKIKVGQTVLVKLDNYPEEEFGVLEGTVKKVSVIPDEEGNYLIEVNLPSELITSYGKQINFKQEMACSAEIITKDLRLIDRFIFQVKTTISR